MTRDLLLPSASIFARAVACASSVCRHTRVCVTYWRAFRGHLSVLTDRAETEIDFLRTPITAPLGKLHTRHGPIERAGGLWFPLWTEREPGAVSVEAIWLLPALAPRGLQVWNSRKMVRAARAAVKFTQWTNSTRH
ncbi:hypothetical protein BaRGS_00023915 [Batillaria attramentaria]|uniref:Uncharacterized protein n=1 Tax=Batillaria attramentaria TaxID=370345 RepID=A0ABD0KCS5_9CAEN